MRKALKIAFFSLLAMVFAIAVLLPFVAPPLVKSIAETKSAELGFPCRIRLRLGYAWRRGPELVGSLRVLLTGSPWCVWSEFGAGFGEWRASVKMNKTEFSERETVVRRLLAKYPIHSVSNLTFGGSIALEASVERTRRIPVPVWSVKVPLRDVSASLTADGKSYEFRGLSVTPGARGIADQMTVSPMFPRIRSVSATGIALSNVYASVRATEQSLMINEAGARVCGGQVNLYSVFLNPTNLNAGLTLFVDNIDAGQVLAHLNGFQGEASGRLHGKVKLSVHKGGKAVRLSEAFLYSTPGEIGKLRMTNPEVLADNLALAGMDEDFQLNVRNALQDLDFSVLKLDLRRRHDNLATLSVRVSGTATRGNQTVPVDINVNINGELEQLINTGLVLSNLQKGKQP